MKYRNEITIKNGQKCIIRNGTFEDGPEVSTFFTTTHGETDYLLSYPEESTRDDEKQSNYLKETTESDREIELLAIVDGKVVGMAGFNAIGSKYKVRHRAEFGITVSKKLGNAVCRNRCKRVIRAAYAALEPSVRGNYDFVFVARSKTKDLKSTEIQCIMQKLLQKAGAIER